MRKRSLLLAGLLLLGPMNAMAQSGNQSPSEKQQSGENDVMDERQAAVEKAERDAERFAASFEVSDEAMRIHQAGMLWDGHNDLPWTMRAKANSSFDVVDISQPTEFHTDIERLKEGGLKVQFWSVFVPVSTMAEGNSHITTIEQIEIVNDMCQRYPDVFELALTADDVQRIVDDGKIASLIGMEGGHSIENSLARLRELYNRGARYMTLTHSKNLDWADSATDEPKVGGLSEFGEEVVREMNKLGMIVDISHVSVDCMKQTLAVTKAPVIFSHSSAQAICDHPRNVPDDVLQMTAENNGVVMVNFFSAYVLPKETLDVLPKARGDFRILADHIDHIVKVAGIDHVGIGSDFDGVPRVPFGMDDVSFYPFLTQELLNRGYSEEEIHKILGGNMMRVFRDVERVATELQANARTP